MTLRFSLLAGGTPACDVASPRRLELDAVLDVRRAGAAVELEGALLIPGLVVVVDALASGLLPVVPVVEAIDMLDPGLLPAALAAVLLTVVDPIALMGFRIVEGGLGCGTNGAVPDAPPDAVLVVASRLVLATLLAPCPFSAPLSISPSSSPFLFRPSTPASISPGASS